MLSVKFHVSTGLGVVGGLEKHQPTTETQYCLIIEDKELKLNY